MDSPEVLALQTDVVREVAGSVSVPWERIVVNYEVLETASSRAKNELTFIVQRDSDGTHSVTNFVLSDAASTALLKLRDAGAAEPRERWSTCILIIDPPGKFRFTFSYDPPKVLNGILDDEYKYYRKYLPHYLEEKGLEA